MGKGIRQYIGILLALAAYYVIHEGARLTCAFIMGTFKKIKFLELGIQVDVHNTAMTDV